jgi:hypothetical protein
VNEGLDSCTDGCGDSKHFYTLFVCLFCLGGDTKIDFFARAKFSGGLPTNPNARKARIWTSATDGPNQW